MGYSLKYLLQEPHGGPTFELIKEPCKPLKSFLPPQSRELLMVGHLSMALYARTEPISTQCC